MAAKSRSTASAKSSTRAKTVNPLMADGVERSGKPDRWSHDDDNIGTTLLGRFIGKRDVTFADRSKGTALIFSPAVVLDHTGELKAFQKIETLYLRGLESAITPDMDKRVVFGIEYTGKTPARAEGFSDFKTFTVVTRSVAALAKLLRECDAPELAQSLADQG